MQHSHFLKCQPLILSSHVAGLIVVLLKQSAVYWLHNVLKNWQCINL